MRPRPARLCRNGRARFPVRRLLVWRRVRKPQIALRRAETHGRWPASGVVIVPLMGERWRREGERAHKGRRKGGKAERHRGETFDRNNRRRHDLPRQARAGDERSGEKSWRPQERDGIDAIGRAALRRGLTNRQADGNRNHTHRGGQTGGRAAARTGTAYAAAATMLILILLRRRSNHRSSRQRGGRRRLQRRPRNGCGRVLEECRRTGEAALAAWW